MPTRKLHLTTSESRFEASTMHVVSVSVWRGRIQGNDAPLLAKLRSSPTGWRIESEHHAGVGVVSTLVQALVELGASQQHAEQAVREYLGRDNAMSVPCCGLTLET